MKIIVIGAGAVGMSVAYFLKSRGHAPTLVEKGLLGEGSTGLSAGIVSVQHRDPLDTELTLRSIRFFTYLASRHREKGWIRKLGLLRLTGDPQKARALQKSVREAAKRGAQVEMLSLEEARYEAPDLYLEDAVAFAFSPDDLYANPFAYIYLLSRELKDLGVEILYGTSVDRLLVREGEVWGVMLSGGRVLFADVVVLAAGVWSARLAERSGLPLPLKPYRTQLGHVILKSHPRTPMVHDLDQGIYFRPEPGGGLLVGDGTDTAHSYDPDHIRSANDPRFAEEVSVRLAHRVPSAIEGFFGGGWGGLCAGTPDRMPLLGPHTQAENLILATGMNGYGFMRAPAIGEIVAALISGDPLPEEQRRKLLFERFRGKEDLPFQPSEGFNL